MWTYVASSQRVTDVDWALRREFLLTNGLGGYASGTILGCNTRRYHGLLVAAAHPPLDRWVVLSHLDELLVLPDGEHYLNTTEYRDGFYPDGFRRLTDFSLDPLPVWRWRIANVEITKRLCMPYGTDCVLVHYTAAGEVHGARLVLSPFVAMRSFHRMPRRNEDLDVEQSDGTLRVGVSVPGRGDMILSARFSCGQVEAQPLWYDNVYHRRETERGLEDVQDLLRAGTATVDLERNSQVTLIATLGSGHDASPFDEAVRAEHRRREHLLAIARPYDQREQALVAAADQFVVQRPHGDKHLVTILAGYPWFADWGRDTMVALPGLCLATGRAELARDVLRLWAGLVSQGMLPNRFEDDNRRLSYNAVDSALWFVQACHATDRAAPDDAFLAEVLWPAVRQILEAYHDGTRFGIRADDDGLLLAGEHDSQLTWMDAKRGGTVFTPRHGKAVEVNALWISALCLAAEWAERLGLDPPRAVTRRGEACEAFEPTFWNSQGGYLYDCVTDGRPDAAVRPNQLLAASVPHAPVTGERGRAVVDVCRRKLLTPVGLRTLAPDDPSYRGTCAGGWLDRDAAYHQGTVWPWLLGPYIDALMATAEIPSAARSEARDIVNAVLGTLDDGALGTIGEVFDGDAPHTSRGCIAQAWSVAEILRVKDAYQL